MFLLDTNVISELRRGHRGDPRAIGWLSSHRPSNYYLSAITLLELEVGTQRVERRDPPQGRALRGWLDRAVYSGFQNRILPVDISVARHAAGYHVPDPASELDALIAATAAVHGMTLVTRNTRDFARLGVPIVDPWEQ